MKLVHQLLGSSLNENKKRRENDFYPTPDWATDALLDREEFTGPIWEPACGEGAIVKRLDHYGYKDVLATDLYDYGFGDDGINFLHTKNSCDNIITNPPFSIGTEFTIHALRVATKKVAIFNKLAFLEGCKRYNDIFSKRNLETVYVFSKRVGFVEKKDGKKNSGMLAFAWYVWNKEYSGDPSIKWIV